MLQPLKNSTSCVSSASSGANGAYIFSFLLFSSLCDPAETA